jgi:hypothetical protein
MALADLMKKGFLTSATATPATPATHRRGNQITVASVATVAVANTEKIRSTTPTVATVAGVAVAKPPKLKAVIDAASFAQFRFDLVQSDIDSGYPADDLHRVNNIAWRLMTTRGYLFDEAITAAALWVSDNPAHADETTFIDVMALFKEIRL